jgi:hypothetical protein
VATDRGWRDDSNDGRGVESLKRLNEGPSRAGGCGTALASAWIRNSKAASSFTDRRRESFQIGRPLPSKKPSCQHESEQPCERQCGQFQMNRERRSGPSIGLARTPFHSAFLSFAPGSPPILTDLREVFAFRDAGFHKRQCPPAQIFEHVLKCFDTVSGNLGEELCALIVGVLQGVVCSF